MNGLRTQSLRGAVDYQAYFSATPGLKITGSALQTCAVRLFPAKRRLHFLQRLEIFLQAVDMVLHLDDRGAELCHRT